MDQAQLVALKGLAQADPTASAYMASADDVALAGWFNQLTTFIVWRPVVPREDLRAGILAGAVDLDNLSAGKRESLLWLASEWVPGNATTKQALTDNTVKTSGSASLPLRNALFPTLYRAARRAEAALAAGTGTTADPGTMSYEGEISYGDASQIRSA